MCFTEARMLPFLSSHRTEPSHMATYGTRSMLGNAVLFWVASCPAKKNPAFRKLETNIARQLVFSTKINYMFFFG